MVLTVAQTTAFFEDATQMAIPHATAVDLENEGIITVNDLAEITKDDLDQIAHNLRRPAGGIALSCDILLCRYLRTKAKESKTSNIIPEKVSH